MTTQTRTARDAMYAKAMAMPGVRSWEKVSLAGGYVYMLEFEGRKYAIDRCGRTVFEVQVWPVGSRSPADRERIGVVDMSTKNGERAARFRTAGEAAASARRFAAREGWSDQRFSRRAS